MKERFTRFHSKYKIYRANAWSFYKSAITAWRASK
jgi:hypothetical protein